MIKLLLNLTITGLMLCLTLLPAYAGDIVTDKSIGMELARDIVDETITACRKDGYHISAVVVDRFGLLRAALRDDKCIALHTRYC